jgi:hypothetical protein
MHHFLLCLVSAYALGANPVSLQKGPSLASAGAPSADSLGWYTMTPCGVLCDTAGSYCLSGCISQSPISSTVVLDTGAFCIIGGFWSSEFSASFNRNRDSVGASSLMPVTFKLYRNSPNPFRAATRIAYDLPAGTNVSLKIYDVNGRQVRELTNGAQHAGRYSLRWDRRDKVGRTCPAGVYFCSLRTEDDAAVEKIVIAE